MGSPTRTRRVATALCLAASLAGALGALTAQTEAKTDSRVYAMDRKKQVLGRTPSDWTAEYWQWVLSIPYGVHPAFDETGALVEVGQRGPVWFLPGNIGVSTAYDRTATIPTGKALLFGLATVEWDNVGFDPPQTVDEMRVAAAEFISAVDLGSLFFTVDGNEVAGLDRGRVQAGPFAYAFPDDNIGQHLGQGTTRGIYAPAVSDGYWVMLRPLPPGEHVIHYGATVGAPYNFSGDGTYRLTVVESNRP